METYGLYWKTAVLAGIAFQCHSAAFAQTSDAKRVFFEPCQVVTPEGDKIASLSALFGFFDEKEQEVMFVLVPSSAFGLGEISIEATYGDIHITKAGGEKFTIGGSRGLVVKCEKFDKLKNAMEDRSSLIPVDGVDLDRPITIVVRWTIRKK